jgi:hypothetical protein
MPLLTTKITTTPLLTWLKLITLRQGPVSDHLELFRVHAKVAKLGLTKTVGSLRYLESPKLGPP